MNDDDDNADDAVCFDRRDTSQIKDTSCVVLLCLAL